MMTSEQLFLFKKLIKDWETFYELDDNLAEKKEAAINLIKFVNKHNPECSYLDRKSIMNARFYVHLNKIAVV